MKKFIAILMTAIALTANADAGSDILEIINSKNSECPISISDGMSMLNARVEDGRVVFTYIIDDMKVKFASLRDQHQMLHDVMASDMATTQNPNTRKLCAYCQANKVNLILRFMNNSSGDHFDIVIAPDDLQF